MPPLLTDREVATHLRKHARTIQRWCVSGRFPHATKQGRTWRIPIADVELVAGASLDADRTALLAAVKTCERVRASIGTHAPLDGLQEASLRKLAEVLRQLEQQVSGLANDVSQAASTGRRRREIRQAAGRPS